MANDDGRGFAPGSGSAPSAPPGGGAAGFTYTGPSAAPLPQTNDQLNNEISRQSWERLGDSIGPPTSGAGGSGYRCSLGELRTMIKQADDMVAAARGDRRHALDIASAKPTAQDQDGSIMHANGLGKWGHEQLQVIQGYIDDCTTFADNLRAVEKNYANQEDSTQVSFRDFKDTM
ncbi:MAG: hypothetical protein ACRDRL_25270 [Sciscionella sp.]